MSAHSESGANNYWQWKKANHKDYPTLVVHVVLPSFFPFNLTERLNSFDIIFWRFQSWWRWAKTTQYIPFSFDLKMRNWPRHAGALISIMSRKWIDAPRDNFPSLSFPLYVFTVLWHRVNWEIARNKNTTSLQWYRTVPALWARLPSFWSSLTLYFQFSKCTRSTS